MLKPTKKKSLSNRGVSAEKKVQDYLTWWAAQSPHREFNRLMDTKAAGRIIKAAAADFDYYSACNGDNVHGLIEVKETEHDYRLARSRVTQLPHLRKREKCGGRSYVLVYHSTIKRWRILTIGYLADGQTTGSWNLTEVQTFATCDLALSSVGKGVQFPAETK